ncbi:MAG TPA: hypothetical protein VGC35_10620 [Allosphingosinicella sp.]|jgi:hypothetical protein
MLSQLNPVEVWTKEVTPSELFNIERQHSLPSGGGQLYFQINKTKIPGLLNFLGVPSAPPLSAKHWLTVRNPRNPAAAPERVAFWAKSQDRMRTGAQNRWRKSSTRPAGWSPAAGFPTLTAGQTKSHAEALLNKLGGVRIFLARDVNGDTWAGFTQGAGTVAEQALPYAHIAWGSTVGGYWP